MKQAGWLRCADCRRVGATIGAGLWARPRLQTMHAGASIIVPAAAEAFRTGGRGFSRTRAAEAQCRPAKASTSCPLAAGTTTKASAGLGPNSGHRANREVAGPHSGPR